MEELKKREEPLFEVCAICTKYMVDPRLLPCAHSFCLKCLESSTISKDSSKCPKCQMEFESPQGGLKDLKRNDFIEQLNILRQNSIKCDGCMENQTMESCGDCCGNYCPTMDHHARIRTTSKHQLKAVTSTKGEINIKKYLNCDEHSELMTLVCEDCGIVVCSHCLTLKHKNHNFTHLSDYFMLRKAKFEEDLKTEEKTLENILKNLKSSEDVIRDNELKASNLKKEIQQRGEDAKKIIDSIVALLATNIDEEMKQLHGIADEALVKLKNMEKELRERIGILKNQLTNLSYANVTETGFKTLVEHETIPNYSEIFSKSFHFDEDLNKIRNIFGNVYKAPQVGLLKEDTIDKNIQSIALYKGNAFVLERAKTTTFKVKRLLESSKKRSYIKFHKHLVEVGNLLVIDGMFFVSGTCFNGHQYILHILKNIHNWELFRIYEHPPLKEKCSTYKLGMSESICGNIVVNLLDKIVHLSINGAVQKTIRLPFKISDALQLNKQHYAVCVSDGVCIVGDKGNILIKHSYHSFFNGPRVEQMSPFRMVKDRRGNIYVCDYATKKVFILDHRLRIKSSFNLKNHLHEMVYDEDRNVLMILSEDYKLLTYAL